MLVFTVGGTVDGVFMEDLRRLKHLVADMEMIIVGGHSADIAEPNDTPSLTNWAMTSREVLALVGLTSGNSWSPGDATRVVTSPLWLVSDNMKWARTMSDCYRLSRD